MQERCEVWLFFFLVVFLSSELAILDLEYWKDIYYYLIQISHSISTYHEEMVEHISRVVQDFIELCYRFSQLVNPCMHLQRSLQQALPSLRFWCLGPPAEFPSHKWGELPSEIESWMNIRIEQTFTLLPRSFGDMLFGDCPIRRFKVWLRHREGVQPQDHHRNSSLFWSLQWPKVCLSGTFGASKHLSLSSCSIMLYFIM